MTVLLASFASFSSPLSNFDVNSQNNLLNSAFADPPNKDEKQEKKEEKLAEKQEKKEEKLAAKQSDYDSYDDNDDIPEFDEDVVVTSSSTTSTAKQTICHIPPGNPAKAHTITVGSPAVPAHLAHGDYVGSCNGPLSSTTDVASFLAEKQSRIAEKIAEKEDKALQRAEKLLEKLEQKIAKLEQRLQKLLEKVESGEYYGNLSSEDAVTNSYNVSFDGTATSLFDDAVTSDVSGEIFLENLVTTTDVSKFKVTGGEIIVGNNIYDVIFGKARTTETSDENNMVLILQTLDVAGNENTVRLTLNFDSPLGDLAEPIGFEIDENSKISGEWFLSGSGEMSLSS